MTRIFNQWRPHPWHGLELGPNPPSVVHAYIEITPFDFVKYEVDKKTGYMRVDRPHRTSSLPPALYGFIPRTYCADRVRNLMEGADRGDGDPLDICVLSSRRITRGEIIVNAHVVGGITMLDHGEADDKIVAVLDNDDVWGSVDDITELPKSLVERLRHYFQTYKTLPGEPEKVQVGEAYGAEHAAKVIAAASADYQDEYGG
ncbi:inorganic pyrophosphatase [Marinihelvus fidelis]|uniref:inorganic diphosphatase n=1 Tax=Marinihelvus fidelis TaxID=2613842 RepID=A0A5N0TF03_9GAMM|nr:inorganic pyrophosphatase [Marinihelvus fidelis]KAA9133191.1 inorganic pyrophosphatase [Marinihelvus fidelis]